MATSIHQLKAYDPESKGSVERRNGYFETSFMPGRSFVSPADFNTQFTDWLKLANSRVVRTINAERLRKEFGAQRASADDDDLARDLTDYDRAFGLVDGFVEA